MTGWQTCKERCLASSSSGRQTATRPSAVEGKLLHPHQGPQEGEGTAQGDHGGAEGHGQVHHIRSYVQ